MEKDLRIAELSDFYRGLLTARQYDILDRYYNLDCSLAEIADSLGIARQSVRDSLVKSREAVERYEAELHLFEKHRAASALIDEALGRCEEPGTREILRRIREVLEG